MTPGCQIFYQPRCACTFTTSHFSNWFTQTSLARFS